LSANHISWGVIMTILNRQSVCETVDRVNAAVFFGKAVAKVDRQATAEFLASRIGQGGSYCGLPAPTPRDFTQPVRVFTGEAITSRAAKAHILGEEACRAMLLLQPRKAMLDSLTRASEKMIGFMVHSLASHTRPGEFCCGRCSVSVWRHALAGGLSGVNHEELFSAGVKAVHANRDGKGRWKRYPFYYTVLVLLEMDTPESRTELRYIAPQLEKSLRRDPDSADRYALRRHTLAQRALAVC